MYFFNVHVYVIIKNSYEERSSSEKKEIAVEKAAMKKTMKKVQKVSKKIWNSITSQAVGSFSKPPPLNPDEVDADDDDEDDDDDDDSGTPHLGDDSLFSYVILVEQLLSDQLYYCNNCTSGHFMFAVQFVSNDPCWVFKPF